MPNKRIETACRVGALALALALLLSWTATLAGASFTSSGAGVRYGGKNIRLGDKTTPAKLAGIFGKYDSRKTDSTISFGFATYLYTFKSKGIAIETFQKKKGDSKEKIIRIIVTGKKIPTLAGMKVGNGDSVLEKKYGTKRAKSGSKLLYRAGKYNLLVYTKSKKITKYEFILNL